MRHLSPETGALPAIGFSKTVIFLAIGPRPPGCLPYLGTNLKSEIAISSLP